MAPKVKDALPQGLQLGNFTLGAPLGQGGFGITYNATHVTLGQHVAIKEYLPMEIASRDDGGKPDVVALDDDYVEIYEKHLQGFVDEAVTLARFKHSNIVRVQDVFKLNGTAYMVMDFEEGPSFERVLRQTGNQDEARLLALLHPLIDALEVVHQAGFIHRDIKPDNIIVRPDGSPVLLDFGAARQAIGVKTRQLTVLMTRDYGPYEQFDFGTGKQGAWTDIYALGATLYRAITGKPPKNAFDRNRARATRQKDPLVKAVDAEVEGYSKGFLTAIDAALAFLPEDRPQSIADWRAMLPPPPGATVTVGGTAADAAGGGGGGARMAIMGAVGGLVVGGAVVGGLAAGGVIGGSGAEVARLEAELGTARAERDQASGAVTTATQAADAARAEADQASAALASREAERDAARAEAEQLRTELASVSADAQALREQYDAAVARLSAGTTASSGTEGETIVDPPPVVVEAQPALSEADAARRDDLIKRGEAAAKALRLSTPAGGNAIEFFREALSIDAASEGAKAGLDDVAARYVSLARDRLGRNDCAKAVDYLNKAVTLVPESSAVAAERGAFDACSPSAGDLSFREALAGGGEGPAMLTLPAGKFMMGGNSEESDEDEKPQREVTFGERFAIGVTEVSFDDWAKYAAATGTAIPDDDGQGQGALPVINVTWAEAKGYAAWLSEQTGAVYRLPTEAEWEYAARGRTDTPRYWGDGNACEYTNAADQSLKSKVTYNNPVNECEDGHVKAAPVGSLKPNAFGLHDMLGNVWEWTADCWADSYAGAPADGTAVVVETCAASPIRGASWAGSPRGVRAANRFRFEREKRINLLGFRVVREHR